MAIYHLSTKIIGRSGGRSAVASAAYRAGEQLHDHKLDLDHDYRAKAGVVHSEILLPEGAPTRWSDRETLWNEVEAGEKRKDAQLARDLEISLPRELGRAEAIRLIQDFVREQFVSRGMVADLNVHWTTARDGEAQPHAHVMLTMRRLEPGASGKMRFGPKETAWNERALHAGWRERWASLANERLAELGHDARIDHRSYAAQGINLEPQHKIGPVGTHRGKERDQERRLERTAEHRAIARRNGEALLAESAIALDALTHQHSTFTRRDMARFVDRHTDGAEQFAAVLAQVEASPALVRLGQDGRGRERFTTHGMLEAEQRMEQAGLELSGRDGHQVGRAAALRAAGVAAQDGLTLGNEQKAALLHVTGGADLALVVGFAGTGKSAMLGVARAAWEAAGLRVRGAALSGIAAEGLEGGSGIASRTLASLEFAWKDGREQLTSKDVLVVDEAGMIGSRQMERVLSAAQAAGAKVVLVGDPEQLQAIEAGAAFRALAVRHGATAITAVRRQREGWQRDATRELATGGTAVALERYAAAGMVQAADTREGAKAALVAGWDAVRRESPEVSQVILAYTRDDVRDLNELARSRMRASGALRGSDQVVQTELGERAFAAGDRVMFRRNERALGSDADGRGGLAVKNGTLGTVLAVDGPGEWLTVRLDGAGSPGAAQLDARGRTVTFDLRGYRHVDHGYAATVHKAQGVTVDRAHVLATSHMDRHAAYVALTRHRDGVALHYAAEDFADPVRLARSLSREQAKDTTLDYDGSPGALPDGREPEAELVRRYAERRGLDPLHPQSEIVVPVAAMAPASAPAPAPTPAEAAKPVSQPAPEPSPAANAVPARPGNVAGNILDVLHQVPSTPPAVDVSPARPGLTERVRRFQAQLDAKAAARHAGLLSWEEVPVEAGARAPLLPATPYQPVTAAEVAAAVDDDGAVRAARGMLEYTLERVYRDPVQAMAQLVALEQVVGAGGVAARLAEKPALLGKLRGRNWLASVEVGAQWELAKIAVPRIGPALAEQPKAEQAAAWAFQGPLEARRRREAVEVPGLSARALAALAAVSQAGAAPGRTGIMPWDERAPRPEEIGWAAQVAPVWTAIQADAALREELKLFGKAAQERLPPRRGDPPGVELVGTEASVRVYADTLWSASQLCGQHPGFQAWVAAEPARRAKAAREAEERRRQAEQAALEPVRTRLVEAGMRSWWRTHHPRMRLSDYGFRAAHDAAKLVEAGLRAEIGTLPEAELRRAVDRLERADRIEAAQAPKPRPGPSPSPF